MNSTVAARGSCLCGAVNIQTRTISHKVGACHCRMCRKWAGGPLLAIDCGSEVTISGEDDMGIFESSARAERGFCRNCGTHLFYRLRKNAQYIVPAGLFDNAPPLHFDHQVFIDEKPDYYSFANDTKKFTAAEVFAQFASG